MRMGGAALATGARPLATGMGCDGPYAARRCHRATDPLRRQPRSGTCGKPTLPPATSARHVIMGAICAATAASGILNGALDKDTPSCGTSLLRHWAGQLIQRARNFPVVVVARPISGGSIGVPFSADP